MNNGLRARKLQERKTHYIGSTAIRMMPEFSSEMVETRNQGILIIKVEKERKRLT